MATRFAGERVYVILLPIRDPLYVIDLSDPANPVLCDVFEMPGWVTHMEVRGMKVIALGVDDSNGYQNVAVSLFDVSDPWNAEMLDRVRIGGYRATSSASLDPRAFTVLDDQGLILVPYFSNRWPIDGVLRSGFGIQLVTFDLEEGDLELAGYYKASDAVIRTRSLGDRVLSLGRDYLSVADTSDIMEPRVTATLELSPWVVDYRTVGDHYIELVRGLGRKEVLLRVFEEGEHDLTRPVNEVSLGEGVEEWFWSGSELHVVSTAREHHQYKHYWWNATVSTYRFDDPLDIRGPASVNFTLAETDDYDDSFWNIRRCSDVGGHVYRSSLVSRGKVSNPVIVEQDVMTVHDKVIALYAEQQLFLVGVDGPSGPVLHSSLEVNCGEFFGLMPTGGRLYLVGVSKYYESRWFYHYRLYPVTLPGLAEPDIGEGIAIPGIPVGSSSDGSRVYTVSRWYLFNRYEFEQTLNVLWIEGGIATLLHAIDVKSMYVNVDGDIANIIMVVRAVGNTQDGIQTWTYYSRVDVVDLWAYVSIQSYWVVEAYYPIYMGQGLIMYKRSGLTGILVMEVGVGTVETARHSDIPFGGLVASRDDDCIHIVQYKYGVQHITFAWKGPDPGNSGGGCQLARSPVFVLEGCDTVSTELTTTPNNIWTYSMSGRP